MWPNLPNTRTVSSLTFRCYSTNAPIYQQFMHEWSWINGEMHASFPVHSWIKYFKSVFLNIYNCAYKIHFQKSSHIWYKTSLINPLRTVVPYMHHWKYEIRYLWTNNYNFVILSLISLKPLTFYSIQLSECSYISGPRWKPTQSKKPWYKSLKRWQPKKTHWCEYQFMHICWYKLSGNLQTKRFKNFLFIYSDLE